MRPNTWNFFIGVIVLLLVLNIAWKLSDSTAMAGVYMVVLLAANVAFVGFVVSQVRRRR